MIDEPPDIIGNILAKVLNRSLENPQLQSRVHAWRMDVVLNTDYYPITLRFDGGITLSMGSIREPTLELDFTLDTMIKIVRGEVSLLSSILRCQVKTKGLLRHPRSAYRLFRLMSSALG